jgi:hypothetical protein
LERRLADVPPSDEVTDDELRWARAVAWARGQALDPRGQREGEAWERECLRIEALKDRIVEIGEDAAYGEMMRDRATDARQS